MRIVVPAMGSRGYVQPCINLCQGLERAVKHIEECAERIGRC